MHDADDEKARRIARVVAERGGVEHLEVRGLGAAVRATDTDALEVLAEDAGAGYFEVERQADDEVVDAVISLLPSLTRAVFVANEPVFARYDDGQIFLRVDDETVEEIRETVDIQRATFDDSAEVAFDVEEGEE